MTDYISRQAAIDALDRQMKEMSRWIKEYDEQRRGIGTAKNIIRDVPSAQQWIPVTERLPEKDGFYLATCDGGFCGEDEPFSGLARFENGKWLDDEEDHQCVLAWMPLPKPYKPEDEP